MKTRVISLVNQKGGVGKTTTTVNLGAYLASFNRKTLLLDFDPQSNLSLHLGVNVQKIEKSITELLLDDSVTFKDVVLNTYIKNLDLLPADIELSGVELELVNHIGREKVLANMLSDILEHNKYEFVLIDCSPSLGLLTLNALTASRELFIPLQLEFFALQGLGRLLQTIDLVRKRINPDLDITGIIPCLFDMRKNLSWEVLEKIKSFFGETVFKTIIRTNVRLAEAPSFGQAILSYAPSSKGAQDYFKLAKEVLKMDDRVLKKRRQISREKIDKTSRIKFLSKKSRILIADNDEKTIDILKEAFSKYTSHVTVVNDIEQAQEQLKKGLTDILITDAILPGGENFRLIKWINTQDYLIDMSIVILTGVRSSKNDIMKAIELGADRYLLRPFDVDRLLIDVNDILDPDYKKNKLEKLEQKIRREKEVSSEEESDDVELIDNKREE